MAIPYRLAAVWAAINSLPPHFDTLILEVVGDDFKEERLAVVANTLSIEDFKRSVPVTIAVKLKAAHAPTGIKEFGGVVQSFLRLKMPP